MTTPGSSPDPLSGPPTGNPSSKPTAFRFKTRRPRDESSPSRADEEARRRQQNHFDRNYLRLDPFRRHHHRSRPNDPRLYDDTHHPNTSPSSAFSNPDTAFRESLYDALADDEGAAYWEGVYGQPIHTYPSERASGPSGPLERMTDDEYVDYVRAKMWEKSHGYMLEERARREEEKKKRREDWKREEERTRRARARVEARLRRGEQRKQARRWRAVWEGYVRGWEAVRKEGESGEERKERRAVRDRIEWPVETGLYEDVGKEAVETFFTNAPQPGREGEGVDLLAVLKAERVRWHPDKIQQRFGGLDVDEGTVKAVTAVFQVVDRMWSDAREKREVQGRGL